MTTSIGRLEDFAIDTPTQVTVNGDKYLVVRRGEEDVCVVRDRCPHMGFLLHVSASRNVYQKGPWPKRTKTEDGENPLHNGRCCNPEPKEVSNSR
jgi:nitrite reductase/ring-hydroxylating ferredoxin subunit